MILEEDYAQDLPDSAKSCNYLKEKADGFLRVSYIGCAYYIPVTKEMKKLLGLKKRGKKLEFPTLHSSGMIDDMLRDIISAIYLQVRETVGAEIREELLREVNDNINNILAPKINSVIESKMAEKEQKLLEPKK